jgi:hypothetical protein
MLMLPAAETCRVSGSRRRMANAITAAAMARKWKTDCHPKTCTK